MFYIGIRKRDLDHADLRVFFMDIFCDTHAHAAAENILFHGNDQFMRLAETIDHIRIERLYKSRVH